MTQARTALVTGAGGFVGGHVAAALVGHGWSVTSLIHDGESLPDGTVPVCGDIRDVGLYERLKPVDSVVHCAGVFGGAATPYDLATVNAGGAFLLARWAQTLAGAETFVFASSGSVYGPSPERLSELAPIAPADAYARSKAVAEDAILNMDGVRGVSLRLYYPVGAGQSRGIAALMATRFLADETIASTPDGGPILTMTSIDDIVRAFVGAAEGAVPGGAYNVGGDRDYSVTRIAQLVAHELGVAVRLEQSEDLMGNWRGDSSAIARFVGPLGNADAAIRSCAAGIARDKMARS